MTADHITSHLIILNNQHFQNTNKQMCPWGLREVSMGQEVRNMIFKALIQDKLRKYSMWKMMLLMVQQMENLHEIDKLKSKLRFDRLKIRNCSR